MRIIVKIFPDNLTKKIILSSGSRVNDLLKKINLRPDDIIVLKGNTPIPVDDILYEEQELSILKVASGG